MIHRLRWVFNYFCTSKILAFYELIDLGRSIKFKNSLKIGFGVVGFFVGFGLVLEGFCLFCGVLGFFPPNIIHSSIPIMKFLSGFQARVKPCNCFFNLDDCQEENNLISKLGKLESLQGIFKFRRTEVLINASIVLYACIHDTVLLILSLFSEIRLNASPIGNGGGRILCNRWENEARQLSDSI